jgi:hypothetical protein
MRPITDTAALVDAYQRERAATSRQLAVPTLSDEGRARLVSRLAGIDKALAELGHVPAPQEGPQRTAEDPAPRRGRAPRGTRTAEEA